MDSKEIIIAILSVLGGYAANAINIQILKFFFKEYFDGVLQKHGIQGVKFRLAAVLLLIDLPGLIQGAIDPQPIISVICASSAFFALIMLLRNMPVANKVKN